MKNPAICSACLYLAAACAPVPDRGPSVEHGFASAAEGIGHLILAPFQIAAGLLEGIASMPYMAAAGVHDLNRGMRDAQADVTLEDTYESAYGRRLREVPDDGDTGVVFHRMKHATEFFQRVLHRYGVPESEHYILTSIDTANGDGYTLFAVVYRPADTIRVIDKYDGRTVRVFSREDRLYYEPFARDAEGRPLDVVIDWAGMPRTMVRTQKQQAILMTLAANSVLNGKRSPGYGDVEQQWMAGAYVRLVAERMAYVRERMKI